MSGELGSVGVAAVIQRFMRNLNGKRKAMNVLRFDVDLTMERFKDGPFPALELLTVGKKLLYVYDSYLDKMRLVKFCNIFLSGMDAEDMKVWYVSLALNKCIAVEWIKHVKKLLGRICSEVKCLKLGVSDDNRAAEAFLCVIMTLCDYSLWKLSAKSGASLKPVLHRLCITFIDFILERDFFPIMNHVLTDALNFTLCPLTSPCLTAAMGVRFLALKNFSPEVVIPFVHCVLTVPASILHLHHSSPQVIDVLNKADFFSQVCIVLLGEVHILKDLKPNSAIVLICNVLFMASLQGKKLLDSKRKGKFVDLMLKLFPICQADLLESQGTSLCWHPLFGWCKGNMDFRSFQSLNHVQVQLQTLWHPSFLEIIFSEVLQGNVKKVQILPILSDVCVLYQQFLSSVKNLTSDILIGLGCNEIIVYKLWRFFKDATGLEFKVIVANKMYASILSLVSHMMLYMLQILNDDDLFEKKRSFQSSDFADIAHFLNNLIFRIIWEEKTITPFSNSQALLFMLYSRDCKRHFCGEDRWNIKGVKTRHLLKELDTNSHRGLRVLTQLPHIYPHRKRVEIFHQRIKKDKECLGISGDGPTTYITIHRGKMLEDGFDQLCTLSQLSLKGTIRVKFINEQGLDEAGIDEMGVFKEYLEETLKIAFNPSLNLFKANAAGHLFPSSSSYVNENHLNLFGFIGKVLGKAVYEGIVVDVPLAPFFLSHLLQNDHSRSHNYLDELALFDQEIYSSLNFIKNYDGDVTDLSLTFSVDETFQGKTISHDLIDGGSAIPVTLSNRLNYVHRMAMFKLLTQVKKQTAAFIEGFHSLVEPSLIEYFSPQELQRLISGDDTDIDVDDLRKHTEYVGGYHASHKVILWLWDILKNHFSSVERGQFLKFVTSCSRPPLLGFKHLNPPFTVRCVFLSNTEESDETVGGILKGIFKRRQPQDRLPSTSTCFNLLKLPNYSKKQVLRDKLRYAIQANCGFELS